MVRLRPLALLVTGCLLSAGCAHHHHHHHGEGKLGMDDLPLHVRDNFDHDHPGVAVKGVEKETEGSVTHYDIRYADQGLMHDSVYDLDGNELKPEKLP